MNHPTMLYRCPGPEKFEGVACETTIVDETEVEAMKADGWCSDWMQAKAEAEAESNAQTGQKAVHKGRGVWSVVDALGAEVATGLTKAEALAKVGG